VIWLFCIGYWLLLKVGLSFDAWHTLTDTADGEIDRPDVLYFVPAEPIQLAS
jgi:hypothetical protein